jgi:hypothetical protein
MYYHLIYISSEIENYMSGSHINLELFKYKLLAELTL